MLKSTSTKFRRARDSAPRHRQIPRISTLAPTRRARRSARNEAAIPPSPPPSHMRHGRAFSLSVRRRGIDRWDQAEYSNIPDRHNLPCFSGDARINVTPFPEDLPSARTLSRLAGDAPPTCLEFASNIRKSVALIPRASIPENR